MPRNSPPAFVSVLPGRRVLLTGLLLAALFDVFDHVADGLQLLRILVGDLRAKFLFKRHDQFDRVQRVSSQIFNELRLGRHLVGIDAELFDNNVLHSVCYGFLCHWLLLFQIFRLFMRNPALLSKYCLRPNSPLHHIAKPPSTVTTCPVTYAARSLAKNRTTFATSSAVPKRPSAIRVFNISRAGSPSALVISVTMKPGATAFAVIPRDASSRATDFVNPMRPAFDAA